MKKLNLGCGSQVPDGWCNVDYALGARLARIPLFRVFNKKFKLFNLDWNEKIYLHDLTTRFPWENSSIDIIYSSHTLEHFSKQDGRRFLTECHRVLRKDGILRIVVPDLRCVVDDYIQGQVYADEFVEKLGVLYKNNDTGLKRLATMFVQYPHKCMYDRPRLIDILNEIGFDMFVKDAFDSGIEDIQLVELETRTKKAVILEGRKR